MIGRVALIGSNGQLASDIVRLWPTSVLAQRGGQLIPLTHADLDVTDEAQLRSVLEGVGPSLVINTAAFHRVDDCETHVREALEVNALGVKNLASVCKQLGAVLVHFSSDYVFDGRKAEPYLETDPVSPISAYGVSKAAGEQILRYVLPDDHMLVRSSGLYGTAGTSSKGGNFVETMLRLQREGRPIRVVDDQVTCPTFTRDLAETLLDLIALEGRGTFHISNAGRCSWSEFASEIFSLLNLKPDFAPIKSHEYASPASRPPFSVLDNYRLRRIGIPQPRPWREALVDYLRLRGRLPVSP